MDVMVLSGTALPVNLEASRDAKLTFAQRAELIMRGVWSAADSPYAWAKVAEDGSIWAGERACSGHKIARIPHVGIVFLRAAAIPA